MQTKVFLLEWLERRAYALAPRTVDSYAATIRLHIAPSIGAVPLDQLTAYSVEGMLSGIICTGKTRTALMAYTILRTACKDALRLGLLQLDPMCAVMRPKHLPQMRRWLTSEELEVYLSAVMADCHQLAWLLALCCGLRRGELCGLRWGDVDVQHQLLHIRNQRVTVASGRTLDMPPKSVSGVRDIALPSELLPLFGAVEIHAPSAYVICKSDGRPITPNALDKAHRQLVSAYGLPPVTPHGLRHTMATQAIEQGVHIRILQYLMGHSSYTTTAKIYAHVDHAAASAAVDKITQNLLKYTRSHPNS